MDCSLPGSSVHGIFQARILEWIAISFSRGSSQPRDWTRVSHIAGRCFTIWATSPFLYLYFLLLNYVLVNPSPWLVKSSLPPVFIKSTAPAFHLHVVCAAFAPPLQLRRLEEMLQSAKSQVFAVCPLTEWVCWVLLRCPCPLSRQDVQHWWELAGTFFVCLLPGYWGQAKLPLS